LKCEGLSDKSSSIHVIETLKDSHKALVSAETNFNTLVTEDPKAKEYFSLKYTELNDYLILKSK